MLTHHPSDLLPVRPWKYREESTIERPHIRTGTLADAEPLAALAERTFRDTFADDNSTDDMDAYVRDSFSLDRVRAELADDVNTFLLAFMDGEAQPDGYAKLRNGRTEPSVTGPDPVELQRLYVDRSAMGQGVGAALMRASLDAARSAGRRTLWLGVWERNARAISFYEGWKFETVGEHVFRLGSDHQMDLIMARPVPGDRGRDAGRPAPPAQIRTSPIQAFGSHLG